MSRNHFDIQRPRKIIIDIPGYDGDAITRKQKQKRRDRKARSEKQERELKARQEYAIKKDRLREAKDFVDDIDSLNNSIHRTDFDEVLSESFEQSHKPQSNAH